MIADQQQEAAEMEQENARLLSFLYACPVGLLEMSEDGTISMVNPMAMQLLMKLGPTPSFNFLQVVETYAPEIRNLKDAYEGARGTICENHRILTRVQQGHETAYEVISCTLIKLGQARYVVSLSDVSPQVRLERKLNVAESWFASLLENSNDFGVASLDKSGNFASVSAAISKQTGFEEFEILGRGLDYLEHDEGAEEELGAAEQLAIAAREGWHLHENWHRHKDGSKVWYQRLLAVRHSEDEQVEDGEVCGYTVVLREGKPRAVDIHKLKHMLTRDHLTGTYNRMHLFEAMEKESARRKRYGQAVSLLMIDIDFFKQVNDFYGHAAGDQVLKELTACCMSMLRPVDTMARMGGEEFAILVPSTDLQGAAQLAERLRGAVENLTIELPEAKLKLTASFGCSELNQACDATKLLADADAALYKAKQAGRNAVVAHDVS